MQRRETYVIAMPQRWWQVILAIAFISITFATFPCSAKKTEDKPTPDFIMDTSKISTEKKNVTSDQNVEMGVPLPNKLRLEGENALRTGNLEHAITVLQKAVELAPNNMDGRILYAEALEKKLNGQLKKDPKLYNYLVKQWLYVARRSEFSDQRVQGYKHLEDMTGSVPKRMDSEKKYLHKVLKPEEETPSPEVAKGESKTEAKTEPKTEAKAEAKTTAKTEETKQPAKQ
jgi:hypothetical protein